MVVGGIVFAIFGIVSLFIRNDIGQVIILLAITIFIIAGLLYMIICGYRLMNKMANEKGLKKD